ncbi:phosphoadenosine phosphosulfate reductase family protein [Natrarchaeobaculum aegyptiacum]|uniref:Phospho-adenylylsulfatesulfotransferase n=1 Tax=Natrarchaeobaculum aegyptiacum TaxID=745377 RepID=A0A2Z2HY01_9EURY|nr:phosphoadenosine phosphosulfate reductase family protein [Natrarchaeobaculum aegyptiacum]ARS88348.1 phospho-adenylylsulfatesulfotransferase [Natrarchaeobaculum aegyptiacum]
MSVELDIDDIDDATLDEKIDTSLEVLEETWTRFDSPTFTCSFGKDSNVVLDLIDRAADDVAAQTTLSFLDHGNHFEATWETKDRLEEEYGLEFETYRPDSSYEELVSEHGPRVNQRKPDLCCTTLKSKPMERMIEGHDGWITGYRMDEGLGDGEESYEWRKNLEYFEQKEHVVRVNPIVHWTTEDVWEYHERRDIPYNELYEEGFECLGCKQCTLDGDALFAYDSIRRVGDGVDEASD